MPPKKRGRRSTSSSSEGDSSECEVAGATEQEVQVDFEAFSISEEDFHGVCGLVKQLFTGSAVDSSALTHLVIRQADHVGSTIKVGVDSDEPCSGDGGDVLGVTTLVHLHYHAGNECVKQIKEVLLSECKSRAGSMLPQLTEVLSRPAGLLISERLLNIPAQIASPMLKSLLSELKEVSQNNPQQFACNYFVVVTRSSVESTPLARKPKKKKNQAASLDNREPLFDYIEWELLQQDSVLSFSYPVMEETQATDVKQKAERASMEHFRTVLVFEATKFRRAVTHLVL